MAPHEPHQHTDVRALRIARHTQRLDEVAAFYRDGLGLTEIGGFRDHDGYDGVFLEIPGTRAHLELTSGGSHGAPAPHPESLVVLYLGHAAAVQGALRRITAPPVEPTNPYWAEHGVTLADPDGFRVVLVPEEWEHAEAAAVRVEEHSGSRAELRWLFELAEDSESELDSYIDDGRVLVAIDDAETIVGHLQLTAGPAPAQLEIKNMAVAPRLQRRGVGRALVSAAIDLASGESGATLAVATAAADIGNLAFYQRLGFRLSAVERDAFTTATGYPEDITIDGIELRDRVWLDRDLEDTLAARAAA